MKIMYLLLFFCLISCAEKTENANKNFNSSQNKNYEKNLEKYLEEVNVVEDQTYYFMHLSQSRINCTCFSDAIDFIKERHRNRPFYVSLTPWQGGAEEQLDSVKSIFIDYDNINFIMNENDQYYKNKNKFDLSFGILNGSSVLYFSNFDEHRYSDIYDKWARF